MKSAKGICQWVWDICSLGQRVLCQPDCSEVKEHGPLGDGGLQNDTPKCLPAISLGRLSYLGHFCWWCFFVGLILFFGFVFFYFFFKGVPLSATVVAMCCSVCSGVCPSNMSKLRGAALAQQHVLFSSLV